MGNGSLICAVLLATGVALAPAAAPAAGPDEAWLIESLRDQASSSLVARRFLGPTVTSFRLDFSTAYRCIFPSFALEKPGRGAAVWVRRDLDGSDRLMLSVVSDGSWEAASLVAQDSGGIHAPTAAWDDRGGLWLAWLSSGGRESRIVVRQRERDATERSWTLGRDGAPEVAPRILFTDGRIRVAWVGYDGNSYRDFALEHHDGSWVPNVAGAPGAPRPTAPRRTLRGAIEPPAGIPSSLRERLHPTGPPASEDPPGVAWIQDGVPFAARLVSLATGPPPAPPVAPPTEVVDPGSPYDRTIVMALGDSVTYGRGSSTDGPPRGYPERLEDHLKGRWIIENRGVPGETSVDILERVDSELDTIRPGLSILMVGINDTYSPSPYAEYDYGPIPPATTVFNLEEICDRILGRGGKLLLSNTTPVLPLVRSEQYDRLAVLNPLINDLAASRGFPYVNVWRKLRSQAGWETLYMDPVSGNHLNDAGYGFLAKKFRRKLLSLGLLSGEGAWAAFDPMIQGQFTEEDSSGTLVHLEDAVSSLATGTLLASCALDLDGDGIDSIAALFSDGTAQSAVIFGLPPAGTLDPAEVAAGVVPLAEAPWMFTDGGRITGLFGIDLDGDGRDEIGLLRHKIKLGIQSIEVWRASQPDEAPPERLFYDRWRIPRRRRVRYAVALQVDDDPEEELLVLTERLKDWDQPQRILLYDAPIAGTDTKEENTTPLLFKTGSLGSKILGLLGSDVSLPPDGRDELVLLRAVRKGVYDRAEAYELPLLPAAADTPLLEIARDRWVRVGGPHTAALERLRLDDGAGNPQETLAVFLDP